MAKQAKNSTATKSGGASWWLEAGDEDCPHCEQTYSYHVEARCFECDAPIVPIYLDVDSARLAQVVSNLLNNAAKFTPADGRIVLRAWTEGEQAFVSVRDTGVGLSSEAMPRIFDQFFTTKEIGRGTGLGLALARSVVVNKHGGNLTFTSEAGRGTTFVVALPVDGADAAAGPDAGNPEALAPAL